MKKYKLLKDLPNIKVGTIFESNGTDYKGEVHYFIENTINISELTIRNNPEWFKEIEEDIKFKIGDIITTNHNIISKVLKVGESYIITDNKFNPQQYKKNCRLASVDEIIRYYEEQGWVKGAKFKCEDITHSLPLIVEGVYLILNEGFVKYKGGYTSVNINKCELIKEPNYPKSWEDLNDIDKKADCEILSAQEICFRRLQDLHKVMIDEYNRINNCDWKHDWSSNSPIGRVIRCYYYLVVAFEETNVYNTLIFPTKELARFSLNHHRELWKQYYEL